MPKAFPAEFRRDVIAVARKREAPLSQIARDFGISEGCLHRWLKRAEIEEGVREGLTLAEEAQIRELKKRNRLLEQENEVGSVRLKNTGNVPLTAKSSSPGYSGMARRRRLRRRPWGFSSGNPSSSSSLPTSLRTRFRISRTTRTISRARTARWAQPSTLLNPVVPGDKTVVAISVAKLGLAPAILDPEQQETPSEQGVSMVVLADRCANHRENVLGAPPIRAVPQPRQG